LWKVELNREDDTIKRVILLMPKMQGLKGGMGLRIKSHPRMRKGAHGMKNIEKTGVNRL